MTLSRATAVLLYLSCSLVLAQEVPAGTELSSANLVAGIPSSGATKSPSSGEIDRLVELYEDARSSGSAEEADTLGKQIVEATIRHYGHDSRHTADALTNLATLQTANDENEAAILNFSAAIEILENEDSRLSEELIKPLKIMGNAQLKAGRADLALDTWSRALHISHVNYGPHSYGQVETLYDLARLYSKAGMHKEADRMWRRISYLRARSFDEGT